MDAKRNWPEAVSTMLWPYALLHAVFRHNNFDMGEDGLVPLQRYSGDRTALDITIMHTWGCPVYVLDARLQGNGMIPKWDPWAQVGVYLGHSPSHAGNVALVLNLQTGHISPQYHLVFDDGFSTVDALRTDTEPDNWKDLVKDHTELATEEHFELAKEWTEPKNDPFPAYDNSGLTSTISEGVEAPNESDVLVSDVFRKVTFSDEATKSDPMNVSEGDPEATLFSVNAPVSEGARLTSSLKGPKTTSKKLSKTKTKAIKFPAYTKIKQSATRISARIKKGNKHYSSIYAMMGIMAFSAVLCNGLMDTNLGHTMAEVSQIPMSRIHTLDLPTISQHVFMAKTDKVDNGVYTYSQMWKQPDATQFIEAMETETNNLFTKNVWKYHLRSKVPKDNKPLMSVWGFKRKVSLTDGEVIKHKARICADGRMQTWGVNYWETYAPVVNWTSIRIMITLRALYQLESRSIDFVQAYSQADAKVDIFLEIPLGMRDPSNKGYVLKLLKNLYDLKDGDRTWWEHLDKGLSKRGFTPSPSDPSVYLKDGCVILTYLDDILIFSKNKQTIDNLYKSLEMDLSITDEDDIDK